MPVVRIAGDRELLAHVPLRSLCAAAHAPTTVRIHVERMSRMEYVVTRMRIGLDDRRTFGAGAAGPVMAAAERQSREQWDETSRAQRQLSRAAAAVPLRAW